MTNWKRNLFVLWTSQFIAMIGMTGVIPFLPLYVRELGVSAEQAPLWSGLIIAGPFVTASLLTPLWGAMGDRYGQKLMVMRAVAGLGITVALMGFASDVWTLLLLRMLQGAASGFVASNNAFVSAQTPQEHAGYALGTLQTSISAGGIIGPLIGGSISDAFGFRFVFFFVGVLCLLSLATVWWGVSEEQRHTSGRTGHVLKNLALVRRDKPLTRLLVMLFIGQTGVVLTGPIFPFYLEQLGAPTENLATLAGVVVSLVGIGTIVSSPWWGKRSDRIGYGRAMGLATLVVACCMMAQALVPSYHWIFPLRAVIGLAVGALLPLTYSELTRRSPSGRKGGIMGLASSATLLGNLTGPLLCAGIASVLELRYIFFVSASLILVVHVLSRWFSPNDSRNHL